MLKTLKEMEEMVDSFPDQFKAGIDLAKNTEVSIRPRNIAIIGMGGSSLPANLLDFTDIEVPVEIIRNYEVSESVDEHTLSLVISYSGNTEETLSAGRDALRQGSEVITLSANGKLEQWAKEKDLPFIKMPKPSSDFQPRAATGYLFGAVIEILSKADVLSNFQEDLIYATDKLRQQQKEITATADRIAEQIGTKTPVLWTDEDYRSAARIARIKINENSKQPAMTHYLPEGNHNAMISFTEPQDNEFIHLIIQNSNPSHSRINQRLVKLNDLYNKRRLHTEKIDLGSGSKLFLGLKLIWLFDWISLKLAEILDIEPVPVEAVEDFKKMMKDNN